MFKVGDKVRCISPGGKPYLTQGGEYEVTEANDDYVWLGQDKIGGFFHHSRFVLVEENRGIQAPCNGVALGSTPDPSKPYPNPEKDAHERQARELVEYKRKMRDFLYGTTSEESD